MALFTVVLDIPDVDVQRFFEALQESYPINDGETYDDYIARTAKNVLQDITRDGLMRAAQRDAAQNIVFPDINVTKG